MIFHIGFKRLVVVLGVMAVAGCHLVTDPHRDFTSARETWGAKRPSSYEYTVRISCFCGGEVTRPVVITVTGQTVESRKYADTGVAVDARWNDSFLTIDALFAEIDQAYATGAPTVDVTFDPTLGYPTLISIDRIANAIDDEYTKTVTNFRAR